MDGAINEKYATHERRASRRAGEVIALIGLGITIGLYVFFTIWWASGINLTVQRNSEWIDANLQLPAKIGQIENWVQQNQGLPAAISKIEVKVTHLNDKLSQVNSQLDRLDTKMDRILIDGAAGHAGAK
jgi:hypothetical protein